MNNISEGFERGGNKEFVQSLSVAKDPVVKSVLNLIGHLTINILTRKSLTNLFSEPPN